MNYAPLARILVVVFGGLGLALEGRILLTAPKDWDEFALVWETASRGEKLGVVAAFVVPVCFYSFCITTCFVRLRKPILLPLTGIIAMLSLWVFSGLHAHFPTIAKNALWTGLPWLFVFADQLSAKPPKPSQPIDDGKSGEQQNTERSDPLPGAS